MAPQRVGIKALEVYLPSQYVQQSELEEYDQIPQGKYTIGLGQTRMGFVNDREDIYSMALTVTKKLLSKHNIKPEDVGRLEVGTETLLDKSKSIKSVLMQLFEGNGDIEGIDTINACYGGTNALFNSVNWVMNPNWDGRHAIVVTGDIAIYSKGAARPTGGAGMVAMLIGPDAPLEIDPIHGNYMEHAYDFYKADFTTEYPIVDGHFSLQCYTKALDKAYETYNKKSKTQGVDRFAYSAFHVPTCKLVTKSYARLFYHEYLANPSAFPDFPEHLTKLTEEQCLVDRDLEKYFLGKAKAKSNERLSASLEAATNTGNCYTASLYLSLASVLAHIEASKLAGQRISMFSYGSGLAASFFSVKVTDDEEALRKLINSTDLKHELEARTKVSPQDYEKALAAREKLHLNKGIKPEGSYEHIRNGAYYLVEVDDKFRRHYAIKE